MPTTAIQGLEELTIKLQTLAADAQGKPAKFAMLKAAQLVRDIARQNAGRVNNPKTPEEIAKNITVRFSTRAFKQSGLIFYRVGVMGGARATSKSAAYSARARQRKGVATLESLGEVAGKGKGNPGGDTFYWRFLEFGTAKAAAKPFLRGALSGHTDAVTAEFVKHYEKAIDRAIKKAGQK